MLVQTPPARRLEGVRAISRLMGERKGLLALTWLDPGEEEERLPSSDMALLIMILDSLDECANLREAELLHQVVDVVAKMVESLELLCDGSLLEEEQVDVVNKLYPSVESSDYAGPHTYTTGEEVPEEFRFLIEGNLEAGEGECSSLGTSEGTTQVESQYDSSDESDSSNGDPQIEEVVETESAPSSLTEDHALWLERQAQVLRSPTVKEGEADQRHTDREHSNAGNYHKLLKNRMFRLNSIRSAVEIDQKLQEFASAFCQDFSAHSPKVRDKEEVTIMNADGVYLTTYRAIHLNIKLRREGHYAQEKEDQFSPISEKEFVDSILQSGIIIYLSNTWLAEVYRLVLHQDLFENTTPATPIVNLCADIDGFGSTEEHGQLLREYRRLQEGPSQELKVATSQLAGRKYSRRIISAVWDYAVSICSKVTSACAVSTSSSLPSLLGTRKAKNGRGHLREAHLLHLRVLQGLLRLSRRVGYQQLSGSVFCLLTSEVNRGLGIPGGRRANRVSTATMLALESVVVQGLELASHSPDCWKHIFRSCQLVARLEQSISKATTGASPRPLPGGRPLGSRDSIDSTTELRSPAEEIFMGFSARPREDEVQESLSMLLIEAKVDIVGNENLKEEILIQCINHLTHKIDKLFYSASSNLNLMSFLGYLRELCFQSHKELLLLSPSSPITGPSLLISTLCEALLRSVKAGRSLLHIMLAWAVVAPHLLEAASHNESRVSKMALQAVHDVISTLLQHQNEMPYFHFHESLFKPYETLVLLELCDPDVQDQVVASIQQFVEGSSSEIRSGWRPLFGTLRAVQMPGPRTSVLTTSHVNAILDVFEAFLSTDSPVVFAHAALDCIMCLVKHIKGTREVEGEELVDIQEMVGTGFSDAALGYIVRCHSVLAKMFLMPICPVFRGAEKIHTGSQPVTVSCTVPNSEVISFDPGTLTLEESTHSYELLAIGPQSPALLQGSGLLKVWFLLIDGVVSALTGCPIKNQAATVTTFFSMLRSLMEPPYSEFGLFCVNHLLLPGLQTWLRTATSSSAAQGLKQTMGLTTDLVLDWMQMAKEDPLSESGALLMLKQLVILLTECSVVAWESIARLGCSCFRHLVSVGCQQLTPHQLEIIVLGLVRASELSLYPLHQLMASFRPQSVNFYGDIGTVRVAARRDSTVRETNRLRQLAQQMLLLDVQREDVPSFQGDPKAEDRSYLFLLQPLEQRAMVPAPEEAVTVRVTLAQVVTGLTAHHLLQQVVGSALLPCTRGPLPTLLLSYHPSPAPLPLPTLLLPSLLLSLRTSHRAAYAFDSRPGLKFLLQKVV